VVLYIHTNVWCHGISDDIHTRARAHAPHLPPSSPQDSTITQDQFQDLILKCGICAASNRAVVSLRLLLLMCSLHLRCLQQSRGLFYFFPFSIFPRSHPQVRYLRCLQQSFGYGSLYRMCSLRLLLLMCSLHLRCFQKSFGYGSLPFSPSRSLAHFHFVSLSLSLSRSLSLSH